MSKLLKRTLQKEEKGFTLLTKNFLRPSLKQIGNSVVDIKTHYIPETDIYIVPLHFEAELKDLKEDLFQVLGQTGIFHEKCILTKEVDKLCDVQTKRKGLILLSETLVTVLSVDPSFARKPSSVKCDAFIALPHQPVMVLTLVDGDSQSDEVVRYNVSVASAMIKTFERFTDECVNPVFGILSISALKNADKFSSHMDSCVQNSSLFVTMESLTMTPVKYEKILTAFWAGVAETKSVVSISGQVDRTYLRFLTKEQCIVLVENINNREVKVSCQPGCGATTLMLEVARRLSRLGKTLLVCESEKERDRLRSLYSNTLALTDLRTVDLSNYMNVVDETGTVNCVTGRLWQFTRVDHVVEEPTRGSKTTFRAIDIQQGITQLEQDIRDGNTLAYSGIQDGLLQIGNLVERLREESTNTESLLQVLKFDQRQEKMKYLLWEVVTLALTDMKIGGMHALYSPVSTNTEALKVSSTKQLSSDAVCSNYTQESEDLRLSVMRELKLGILELERRKGRDLFSIVQNVTIRDKTIRNYLQTKADFLEQDTKQEEIPDKDSISAGGRKHIAVVEAGQASCAERHQVASEKGETYQISRRQITKTDKGDELVPICRKHKSVVRSRQCTPYQKVRGVVKKSVSKRIIQTKGSDGMMDPSSDGLMEPDGDGMMETGSGGLMEPGGDGQMEPGSDGMMEPRSDGVMYPGSDWLMEPGSDVVVEPGSGGMDLGSDKSEVMVNTNTEDTTGEIGRWVEKPSVLSGEDALEEIVRLKNTFTDIQKKIERQEAELNTKDCVPEWEYNLAFLSRNIAAMTIKEDIMHVIGEDDLPVSVFQSLEQPRGGVQNKTPVLHHLRQFQHGTLRCTEIFGILQNIIKDDQTVLPELRHKCLTLEKVYGGPVHIVGELESRRSHFVSCPVMKLDKSRVNTDRCHVSTDGGTLVNTPDRGQYNTDSGQYNTDRFRRYWGTCSSPPIPLPPSPSTLTAHRYWESHSRLSVAGPVFGPTLLEMGICGVGEVDTGLWVSEQTRSSWTVCVVECGTHRHRYCTQVRGEGRQVGGCYNTKSITDTTVVYKYGVVLDVERGRVAFLDLDRDIVIEKMDVRITQPLRAMFGVRPRDFVYDCDIQMRLVSGGEIAMTGNKQSLIYKALSV